MAWINRIRGLLPRVVASFAFSLLCLAAHAELAVIVHPENPLQKITTPELKKIFLGRMPLFPDSKREVHAIDLPDENPVFQDFYRRVVQLEGVELKRYRAYYLFSGRGRLPTVANSPAEVVETVRTDKGAIGYVSQEDVTPDTRILLLLPSSAAPLPPQRP